MSEENTNTNHEQQENTQSQENNQNAPIIDYGKLADIIAGKQSATEDSVLKGYFKQQGLSGDEMKQANLYYYLSKEPRSQHGSVRGRVTHFVPTVQGNGGTPIFALKWVCRTDTNIELPHCSYRQIQ